MDHDGIKHLAEQAGIPAGNISALANGRLESGIDLLGNLIDLAIQQERDRCYNIVMNLPLTGDRYSQGDFNSDTCKSFALVAATMIRAPECESKMRETGELF